MTEAIAIKNLKFAYAENQILNINDFSVQPGEFVFLHGASGSGKSTLLELLAGVLPTQSGQLQILGENLHDKSAHELDLFRAKNIGYIFQSFNLIPYLSVVENIQLPLMFLKSKPDQQLYQHLIQSLQLDAYVQRKVTDLSVGQQQRVAVARALMKQPKLILADEPTSALDYDHREKFLQLLFQICREQKTTVVFVSHDRTIEKLFTRVVGLATINSAHHQSQVIV